MEISWEVDMFAWISVSFVADFFFNYSVVYFEFMFFPVF